MRHLVYAALVATAAVTASAGGQTEHRLGPDETVTLSATTAEAVGVAIVVPAGRVLNVTVTQLEGMPGLVTLDSAGAEVTEADLGKRQPAARQVLIPGGTYRLRVQPSSHSAVARRFTITAAAVELADERTRARLEAERRLGDGERAYRQKAAGYLTAALAAYEQSLAQWRTLGAPVREADLLAHIGLVRYEQGDMKAALDAYGAALDRSASIDDAAGRAAALYGRSLVAGDSGQQADAERWANEALAIRRSLGDLRGQAETLFVLATMRFVMGKHDECRAMNEEAVDLARRAGDRVREADGLNFLGVLEAQLGRLPAAIDLYTRALAIDRDEHEPVRAAQRLNNLGSAYNSAGDVRTGLSFLEQALPTRKTLASPNAYGNTLYNVGLDQAELGDYEDARHQYEAALALFRRSNYPRSEGFVLRALGDLYLATGEDAKAERFLTLAAVRWRSISDRRGEVLALNSLGELAARRHEYARAARLHAEALAIAEAATFQREAEQTHGYLARVARERGDFALAAAEAARQLDLARRIGDRIGEAGALQQQGAAWRGLRDFDRAREALQSAGDLGRSAGTRMIEAISLDELARVERDAGRLAEADTTIADALRLIESVGAASGSRESRMRFAASHRRSVDLAIDVAMQRGDAAKAFELSEHARTRGLVDMMREARVDIRQGVDAGVLERERRIEDLLNAKHDRLTRLLGGPHAAAREAEGRAELDRLVEEYQGIQAEIRASSPAYAGLMAPARLTAGDVRSRLLDAGTTLVEFWLGDDRSYAWVVRASGVRGFRLPPRSRVAPLAKRAYDALNARDRMPKESADERSARVAAADRTFGVAASSLGRMLLGPLRPALGGHRLWIVADGELEYVPFAALPYGAAGDPLIASFEIAGLPSASVLAVVREQMAGRSRAPAGVAVFADPVYRADDERVTHAAASTASRSSSLSRLRFSRDEADAILSLAPRAMSRARLDFDANRIEATHARLGRYRVVHFATHGVVDSRHPELSGLVLSMVDAKGRARDGFVRLHEIYNMKLGADLVVLSACQTALGEEVRSEGLIGLVRGFMYAGSPQVVASLWSVRDRTTTELMRRFYDGLLGRGVSPEAALRAAQLDMWKQSQWRLPYYWAAFTVQGGR